MTLAARQLARHIAGHAMQAVDVRAAVRDSIAVQSDSITLAGQTVRKTAFDRILIIAVGKAAVPMHSAAAPALTGIPMNAVVVAPPETLPGSTAATLPNTLYLPGDHPIPTQRSLAAANAVLAALSQVDERTGVLFLVSGGASAMVEQPLDPAISLADLRAFSTALVGCGLGITEMNAVRKHLSAVKGGRLAQQCKRAAWQATLLVSDVPHAAPDAVGSGPSLPDSTTVSDCRKAIPRLIQAGSLPQTVQQLLTSDDLPETPKSGDQVFAHSFWRVILSSDHLEQAAVTASKAVGIDTVVDNTCDDWDYRDAADYLLHRAQTLANAAQQRVCMVSVGELSVTLTPAAGTGGRNQQFALWCANTIATQGLEATVLSIGSDGIDGHSHAAGAVCDETTPERAKAAGWSCANALERFDTTPLLSATGDAIVTGPTGNNLRDLRLILMEPPTS